MHCSWVQRAAAAAQALCQVYAEAAVRKGVAELVMAGEEPATCPDARVLCDH